METQDLWTTWRDRRHLRKQVMRYRAIAVGSIPIQCRVPGLFWASTTFLKRSFEQSIGGQERSDA